MCPWPPSTVIRALGRASASHPVAQFIDEKSESRVVAERPVDQHHGRTFAFDPHRDRRPVDRLDVESLVVAHVGLPPMQRAENPEKRSGDAYQAAKF